MSAAEQGFYLGLVVATVLWGGFAVVLSWMHAGARADESARRVATPTKEVRLDRWGRVAPGSRN